LQFIATAAGGARQVINGIRVGTTTSYRAIWTPTNPDTYTITTQASVGNVQGTSTGSRRVVVSDIVGLAPSITLTRAAGVSGVPGTATTASTADFAATAADPDGAVVEVEFFLNRNSIGLARRDPSGNTWRITASFAGLQPGATEIVALARDSSGNIVASPTSNVTVNAAASIAPSITITPSTTNPAFNRQVQLRANARDTDGTVNSVQFFANATGDRDVEQRGFALPLQLDADRFGNLLPLGGRNRQHRHHHRVAHGGSDGPAQQSGARERRVHPADLPGHREHDEHQPDRLR
jgi:hypothetical protein